MSISYTQNQIMQFRKDNNLWKESESTVVMRMYKEKMSRYYKPQFESIKQAKTSGGYWDNAIDMNTGQKIKAGVITIDGKWCKGLWVDDKSPTKLMINGVNVLMQRKENTHLKIFDHTINSNMETEFIMFNNINVSCVEIDGRMTSYQLGFSDNLGSNDDINTVKINSHIGFTIYRPQSFVTVNRNVIIKFLIGLNKYVEREIDIDSIKNATVAIYYDRIFQQYIIKLGNITERSVKIREIFGRAYIHSFNFVDGASLGIDYAGYDSQFNYYTNWTICNFENESTYKEL